ncbi:MAG: PDC sensor domain-containing protein, partial [Clostridiaceae bacterium]
MKRVKDYPYLRQIFLRMLFFRLFMPLIMVSLITIVGIGYLGKRNLEDHQNQITKSVAYIVDNHLDQGARVLDAVARVSETSGVEDLSIFMKSTWEAYGYFETIYYLDKDNKITLMTPYDSHYIGLDMSNLPDFKGNKEKKSLFISRPF